MNATYHAPAYPHPGRCRCVWCGSTWSDSTANVWTLEADTTAADTSELWRMRDELAALSREVARVAHDSANYKRWRHEVALADGALVAREPRRAPAGPMPTRPAMLVRRAVTRQGRWRRRR